MVSTGDQSSTDKAAPARLRPRLVLGVLGLVAAVVIWMTIEVLSERREAAVRNQAEVRLTLFAGNILSELRRHAIVPQLLSRDPLLREALQTDDYTKTTQRLIAYREEIGAQRLLLLDRDGRTVASSERTDLGANFRSAPFHVDALRSNTTVFNTVSDETGRPQFAYSRRIEVGGDLLGVIVTEVDLSKYERSWDGISEAVIVTDSSGRVLLSTEPRWLGKTEEQALTSEPPMNALMRTLRARTPWSGTDGSVLHGKAVMRSDTAIPFQGWRIVSFSAYTPVRERVAAVVAVEVMVFAVLAAGLFYFTSRSAERRSARLQQESAALRRLNLQLQRAIAERDRAEKNLEVAEQTIAALGEMSAAVSHELNQPLAAMKTYLAGARLLLSRKRSEEATVSLHRINDLIDRMSAITRQLKSHASKGEEAAGSVDLREVVGASLDMMAPQLRQKSVRVAYHRPETPMYVFAERFRLEQVLVNLLRNSIDATATVEQPQIDIVIAAGRRVSLSVIDNGVGIADLESLFEPFYTTKSAGDGLGLGLAISSSIVAEFGGRLTAQNRSDGGAVFEMQLPRVDPEAVAAQ
jgi:two-component system C4-dicarboxylate transport sensor histidine kinase DctB